MEPIIDPSSGLASALIHYAIAAIAAGILSAIVGRRSQIDAWAEAHPRIAGLLKILRAIGIDRFLLQQGASLAVRGKLPAELRANSRRIQEPPSAPSSAGGALSAVLLAVTITASAQACDHTARINWPKVAECAPSLQELSARVLQTLLDSGEGGLSQKAISALEGLANEYGQRGPDMVVCAVRQIVDDISGRVSASPSDRVAARNGRAFLENTGNGGAQ